MTTSTRKTSLAVVASDQPPGPAALRQMQGRGLWVLDAAKRLSASLSRRSTLSLLDVELADSVAAVMAEEIETLRAELARWGAR